MNAVLCVLLLATYVTESNEINAFQSKIKSFFNDFGLAENKRIPNDTNKLVCFYVFTATFKPQIMDGLCTHINVGFFGINKTSNNLQISSEQEEILHQINLLKEKTESLRIILSVGGAGDMSFSTMVSNHTTRKMFIRSCIKIIKKFNIDGIDLDWEWPVVESGNAKEKIKFIQLLHEIRLEFNRHEKKYILSLDVPSAQTVIELGYYVNYIAGLVDYVNVMCYDYHYFTKLYPFTGHNAPLFSSRSGLLSENINSSIYFWISNSMPREKIVLGVPTYGHTFEYTGLGAVWWSWPITILNVYMAPPVRPSIILMKYFFGFEYLSSPTLTFSNQHSLVAPAKGFGSVGNHGFADYQQICEFLKHKDTTVVCDEISKVPYAYRFPEWISYDDERSLSIKGSYIQKEKLGGAMIFSVNSDDFNGTCKGDGLPLPLIRKIRNILFNEV